MWPVAVARAVLAKWGAQQVPASAAEFALQALVAAGHVTQERVDQALALPGAPARPAAPAGYALVPVEPTEDMFIDGMEADCCGRPSIDDDGHVRSIWAAMLAAAPQPVAREPLTDEHLRVIERMHVYAHTATLMDFARAIERAHGITTTGRKDAP